jgi:hypothetical protein
MEAHHPKTTEAETITETTTIEVEEVQEEAEEVVVEEVEAVEVHQEGTMLDHNMSRNQWVMAHQWEEFHQWVHHLHIIRWALTWVITDQCHNKIRHLNK